MHKIIAFEGIDGLGKTTHARVLSEFLTTMKIDNLLTQELYGDDLRSDLKAILDSSKYVIDGYEELLLISAARRWHYRNIIQPALEKGLVIIVDRFVESTWAYQGGGRKIPDDTIKFFQDNIWNVQEPDLTIYLQGLSHRTVAQDKIEAESDTFFANVIKKYDQRNKWRTFYVQEDFDLTQGLIQEEVMYFLTGESIV
jgi:dTMP kinase